ncbi:hypothetical protein, partial [Campylobacter sp. US33a]|uniref:hypothetical protein n=1 Tax=Campylobacter sp. US33a TaxID=2498120 RepID=UPI0010685847
MSSIFVAKDVTLNYKSAGSSSYYQAFIYNDKNAKIESIVNQGKINIDSTNNLIYNDKNAHIGAFINEGEIYRDGPTQSSWGASIENEGIIDNIINKGKITSNTKDGNDVLIGNSGTIGTILNDKNGEINLNHSLYVQTAMSSNSGVDNMINRGVINANFTPSDTSDKSVFGFIWNMSDLKFKLIENAGTINLTDMTFVYLRSGAEDFINTGAINIKNTGKNDNKMGIYMSDTDRFYNNGKIDMIVEDNSKEYVVIQGSSMTSFINDTSGIISIDKGIAVYASDITTFTNSGII